MANYEMNVFRGESGRLYLVVTPSSIVGESYWYDALSGEKLADRNYMDEMDGAPPNLPETMPWAALIDFDDWPNETKAWVGQAGISANCYAWREHFSGEVEQLWLGENCQVIERTVIPRRPGS